MRRCVHGATYLSKGRRQRVMALLLNNSPNRCRSHHPVRKKKKGERLGTPLPVRDIRILSRPSGGTLRTTAS
jgi:hypothetical protein